MKPVMIAAALTCVLSVQAAKTRNPSAKVGNMTMTVEQIEKVVGWNSHSWVQVNRYGHQVVAADQGVRGPGRVCAVHLLLSAQEKKLSAMSFNVSGSFNVSKEKPWSWYLRTIDEGKPWENNFPSVRTSGSRLIAWWEGYEPRATSLNLTLEAFEHKEVPLKFRNVKLSAKSATVTKAGITVSVERIEPNAKDPHYTVHFLGSSGNSVAEEGRLSQGLESE